MSRCAWVVARTGLLATLLSTVCGTAVAQQPIAGQPHAQDPPVTDPPENSRLSWAVSHRVRYAGLRHQFRPGLSGDDQALVFRTTLQADLKFSRVTLGGELQDARAYLTDGQSNVSTTLVDTLDLLQAFAVFGSAATKAGVPEVQIGRFGMELGSGRLVAREAFRDVARTFTGAKARWRLGADTAVTAFAVLPVLALPDNRDALLHNDWERDKEHLNQRFWGGLFERQRLWLDTSAEVYLYGLGEHDDGGRRATRNRRLWTAGTRFLRHAAAAAWDGEAEVAWQRGRARASSAPSDTRDLDVSAGYLHLHAGYTFAHSWSPRLSAEYDHGSGDSDPADGEWNRFDALFGHRRADLGPTSIYGALGRENIDAVGGRVSVVPHTRVDAFAGYKLVRLAAAADTFASTGVRDPTGQAGRAGGQQIDMRVRAWLVSRAVRLEVGATRLIAGRFLRQAPNATREGDTTFFYGDVTYAFRSQ